MDTLQLYTKSDHPLITIPSLSTPSYSLNVIVGILCLILTALVSMWAIATQMDWIPGVPSCILESILFYILRLLPIISTWIKDGWFLQVKNITIAM